MLVLNINPEVSMGVCVGGGDWRDNVLDICSESYSILHFCKYLQDHILTNCISASPCISISRYFYLKVPIMTATENKFLDIFPNFGKNKV